MPRLRWNCCQLCNGTVLATECAFHKGAEGVSSHTRHIKPSLICFMDLSTVTQVWSWWRGAVETLRCAGCGGNNACHKGSTQSTAHMWGVYATTTQTEGKARGVQPNGRNYLNSNSE